MYFAPAACATGGRVICTRWKWRSPSRSLRRKEVEGIFGFQLQHPKGTRAVLAYARTHRPDLVRPRSLPELRDGRAEDVDQYVKVPALIVAPDGSKAAYIMSEQSKQGVYVASDGIP